MSCDERAPKRSGDYELGSANCFADPKLGSISSLRCQKSRTRIPKDATCEVMFRGRYVQGLLFKASVFNLIWWSQTGSNRRPHACKARALPAELWPRTRRRMPFALATAQRPSFKKACRAEAAKQRR